LRAVEAGGSLSDSRAPRAALSAWSRALRAYADPRVALVVALGFSSGLPFALTGSTLAARLQESGVDLTSIGLFALVGLPYSLKPLWAPLIDRAPIPMLGRALGQRRSWVLATQLGLGVSILGLSAVDPTEHLRATALWALLVAFLSASQDIVIDAYRVEVLSAGQQGPGAGAITLGYRLGMLASGAGALLLAAALGWAVAYTAMTALLALAVVAVLLGPEPPAAPAAAAAGAASLASRLRRAIGDPLVDLLRRPGAWAALGLALLYKLGDALAGGLSNPFYLQLGFTLGEVASLAKVLGAGALVAGGLLGGLVVARYGLARSLLICGALQLLSNLAFVALAQRGRDLGFLAFAVGAENLAAGMGGAALVAYLSSLCSLGFTAMQYALLSSVAALGRTLLSAPAGWLVERLGWATFFALTAVAALPGLLLIRDAMRPLGGAAPREAAAPRGGSSR
jgi:PAT family beta-lactamase induction signal transducer AmpG